MTQTDTSKAVQGASVSNRIVICSFSGCYDMATIKGFCRLHYLSNWKRLKAKEAKSEGLELQDYLKQLAARFPEEYFEKLRNEIDEMASKEAAKESAAEERQSMFEADDADDDVDYIISGIRVEDF